MTRVWHAHSGLETYGERIRSSHLGSSDQHLPDRLFRITTQRPDRDRVNCLALPAYHDLVVDGGLTLGYVSYKRARFRGRTLR